MTRSHVLMLGVGVVVGCGLGYALGRRPEAGPQPAAETRRGDATGRPATDPPPRTPELVQPVSEVALFPETGVLRTTPAGVKEGMTRAEAAAALVAGGFSPAEEAVAVAGGAAVFPADLWRVRKPWQGGYHFVTVRFQAGKAAEVFELWNDP